MVLLRPGDVVSDIANGHEYVLDSKLGEGGFGVVYLAVQRAPLTQQGTVVALKVLDKARITNENKQLVVDEITLHNRMDHPSIVSLRHVFERDEAFYLVMDYCEGGDLDKDLNITRKGRPWAEDETREAIKQIAEGLQYLHKNNVLHRDIKLSNVFLTKDGKCKLGDFGLAKQLIKASSTNVTMCGTPNTMAPEVASRTPYSFPADIWSLGVIMYTLLVGKPPFDTGEVRSTIQSVKTFNPQYPATLSQDAIHLINGMLQKEDPKRFKLKDVLEHPFIKQSGYNSAYDAASSSLGMTYSDSGIGTSTLNGQPFSSTRKWPEIRTPLLGNLTEVEERQNINVQYVQSLSKPRFPKSNSRITQQSRASKPTVPLAGPFTSVRLRATERELKPEVKGRILECGKTQLEYKIPRSGGESGSLLERMTVSVDGLSVVVEKEGASEAEEYRHETLPQKYWKKYNFLARYVQVVREATPKVTLYSSDAACQLMENLPVANFEARFYSGAKVKFNSASSKISLQESDSQPAMTFSYPLNHSIYDPNLRLLHRFEELHVQCKTIDDLLTSNARDLPTNFPAVIGRKPSRGVNPAVSCVTTATVTNGNTLMRSVSHPGGMFMTGTSSSQRPMSTVMSASASNLMSVHKLYMSIQSEKENGYRVFRFDDGTVLRLGPNNAGQPEFTYLNAQGQWEAQLPEMSLEMQAKVNAVQENAKQKSQRSRMSQGSE